MSAVEVQLVTFEERERRPDLDLLATDQGNHVREEPVAAVAAEHVEADGPLTRLVEDHVDDASQLDAVQDDPPVEKLDRGHATRILPMFARRANM